MQPASASCSIAAPQDLDLASNSRSRHNSHSSSSRRLSRRRQLFSSKFILLALSLCFLSSTNAFSPSPSSARRGTYTSNFNTNNNGSSSPLSNQSSTKNNKNNSRQARIYRNAVAEPAAAAASSAADSSRKMTDFQRRMKGLVSSNNKQRRSPGVGVGNSSRRRSLGMPGQRSSDKPSNIKTVITLDEYKQVLDDNEGKMVVVRFFATWCKACKAIQPPYYRMATLYPHITFLEVPVTNENANLHQGLEVPSLPYGHIYYPEAGLVEEMKISKKYFHNLVKNVRWYDQGKCKLEDYVVVPSSSSSVNEDE